MANTALLWRGAVEPAESGASGNEYKAWKGAVEPAAPDAAPADEASLNTEAETRELSGSTICDRSGMLAYPHELVKDPYSGNMVLKRYADEPQRITRKWRSESGAGSRRAENNDTFITTAITPEDL